MSKDFHLRESYEWKEDSNGSFSFLCDTKTTYNVLVSPSFCTVNLVEQYAYPIEDHLREITFDKNTARPEAQDDKRKRTLFLLIQDLFAKDPYLVLVFTFDNEDGKYHKRQRVFYDRWFVPEGYGEEYHWVELPAGDVTSVLVARKDNPIFSNFLASL